MFFFQFQTDQMKIKREICYLHQFTKILEPKNQQSRIHQQMQKYWFIKLTVCKGDQCIAAVTLHGVKNIMDCLDGTYQSDSVSACMQCSMHHLESIPSQSQGKEKAKVF